MPNASNTLELRTYLYLYVRYRFVSVSADGGILARGVLDKRRLTLVRLAILALFLLQLEATRQQYNRQTVCNVLALLTPSRPYR